MTNKTRHEQTLMLQRIEAEWRELAPQFTPPMMWIVRHQPIESGVAELNSRGSFPEAVWFLNEDGMRAKDVWKWQRFVAVQMQPRPPWFAGTGSYFQSSVFGKTHEIGWAAFAPYENSDLYYLEKVWGHLFGVGDVITFEDSSKHLQQRLWVS